MIFLFYENYISTTHLGHNADQHVRKPTVVESLRGKKIVHVAVGALHCLAVTEGGQGWNS